MSNTEMLEIAYESLSKLAHTRISSVQFLSTQCGKFIECKNPRNSEIIIRLHKKSCDVCKNKKIRIITVNDNFAPTVTDN